MDTSIRQTDTNAEVDQEQIALAEAFGDPEIDVSATKITAITALYPPYGVCCG